MKTALLLIATGKRYHEYARSLIASAKKYFVSHEVFLFTDSKEDFGVNQFPCPSWGFPEASLFRYHMFLTQEAALRKFDYVFYVDVDTLCVSPIGSEMFADGLTVVIHKGFHQKVSDWYLETDPRSSAFLQSTEQYYVGGFNGGTSKAFLEMAKTIRERVDKDAAAGIVAKWHDESHLNRYLSEHPPAKILSSDYCFPEPELHTHSSTPKIVCLDKQLAKVSIIVPLYNKKEYIAECLQSALDQKYRNVEVVVVNDGSTDGSDKIARQYPVRVLDITNRGIAGARNAGIMESTGEFILPLDADDWIEPDYLRKTVPLMTEGVGIVSTDMQRFGMQDQRVPAKVLTYEQERLYNEIPVCSLIRREALLQCGGYTSQVPGYEDWSLWADILKRGWKMAVVNEPLFHYRVLLNAANAEADKHRDEFTKRIQEWHPL